LPILFLRMAANLRAMSSGNPMHVPLS
jgi:hypothetical protein